MKKTEIGVFIDIYNGSDKKSELSGDNLRQFEDSEWFLSCFAHVIPKNGVSNLVFPNRKVKDALLRHNPENIMLVTPIEHHLIDHGTEDQRKKHEIENGMSFKPFFELKQRLIEQIQEILKKGDYEYL